MCSHCLLCFGLKAIIRILSLTKTLNYSSKHSCILLLGQIVQTYVCWYNNVFFFGIIAHCSFNQLTARFVQLLLPFGRVAVKQLGLPVRSRVQAQETSFLLSVRYIRTCTKCSSCQHEPRDYLRVYCWLFLPFTKTVSMC